MITNIKLPQAVSTSVTYLVWAYIISFKRCTHRHTAYTHRHYWMLSPSCWRLKPKRAVVCACVYYFMHVGLALDQYRWVRKEVCWGTGTGSHNIQTNRVDWNMFINSLVDKQTKNGICQHTCRDNGLTLTALLYYKTTQAAHSKTAGSKTNGKYIKHWWIKMFAWRTEGWPGSLHRFGSDPV